MTDFATDYSDVFNAIVDAIGGRTIVANGQAVTVPLGFSNRQPELRNADGPPPSYPNLTIRLFPGIEDALRVNESVAIKLSVESAAPYLEGVKAPAIPLEDGQTIRLKRWGVINGQLLSTEQEIALSASDFVDIGAATPLELANVLGNLLSGVSVTLRAGNIVRISHNTPGAGSMLQIVGGTAAALLASFPTYRVVGRTAGQEMRRVNPPIFYNFLFHLVHKTNREDHYALVTRLVERLFLLTDSQNERVVEVAGNLHTVDRGAPMDDPMAEEGVFIVTVPFTLRAVPIMLDEAYLTSDNFNGGNYDGSGRQPLRQAPLDITLVLDVGAVDPNDSL